KRDGQHQREFNVVDRAPYRFGGIVQAEQFDRWRERRLQLGEKSSDVVDNLDRIRSRLPRDGQKQSAPSIVPGNCFVVLDAVDDVGKLLEPQWNAVAPLDDQ